MRLERHIFFAAVGVIAPHVADDNFIEPVFFIHSANGQGGEELTDDYYEAAHEPKQLWTDHKGGHVGAQEAHPEEYERRVVGFFNDALNRRTR